MPILSRQDIETIAVEIQQQYGDIYSLRNRICYTANPEALANAMGYRVTKAWAEWQADALAAASFRSNVPGAEVRSSSTSPSAGPRPPWFQAG